MLRVLKSMMAEFSYFLEKYFDITSILWSVLFISVCCAIVSIVVVKVIEILLARSGKPEKKCFPIYIGCTLFFSYIVNRLLLLPQTWDSKLQRVMSNFQYVLSFTTNRRAFLDSLMLPDNVTNQDNLFNIAMYLNDSQWKQVLEATGDGGWYFQKVQKALTEILRLGDNHLSLNVVYQNWMAYIPMIFIILLGIALIIKHQKISGMLVLISGVLCIVYTFGTSIFMCIMLYLGSAIYMCLSKRCKQVAG